MGAEIISRSEAKSRGLTVYFTGVPCCHGHVSSRWVASGCCGECQRAKSKKWKSENRRTCNENNKKWASLNREKIKDGHRNWTARNPDRVFDYNAKYKALNPEKRRSTAARWYENNPHKNRQYKHARRAREQNASGSHTVEQIEALFESQRGKCAYCRKSIRDDRHLDHIESLVNGGSNAISNLQWTCPSCNRRKNAKDPVKFAQSIGLLL